MPAIVLTEMDSSTQPGYPDLGRTLTLAAGRDPSATGVEASLSHHID